MQTYNDLKIDKAVGLTALRLYVENSNLDVGQVTVRHLVFSELIVQIREGKGLTDAEEVFRLCFGNNHTIKEGKGKKVYKSPLSTQINDFGIPCIKISPRLGDLVVKEVKAMEINEANVIAACEDLMVLGRMFQETTIDSAKTMDKVTIPYGEDMIHVKLNSREQEEDDFNIKCDWKYYNSTEEERQRQITAELRKQISNNKPPTKKFKSVSYYMNRNESKTTYDTHGTKKIFVRHIADFYQGLRSSLLTQGLEFADRMMNEEQQFSLDIRANITTAMKRIEMKQAYQLCLFFHDIFRTIQSYQSKSIVNANTVYPRKSAALEEHVKGIKTEAKIAIDALSNQFRVEFNKLDLSELDRIYVLLHTVLSEGNNASYAHSVLAEEFFKFVINVMEGDDNVPQYTEDRLVYCDFDEGDKVTFHAGKSVVGNMKAYAAIPLEGEFIIRKNAKGKLVASQSLHDVVKMPEVKDDELIFVTKPGGGKDSYTSNNLSTVTKAMMANGAKVTLVPYVKGKDIHDAIVINNTVIGSFRCSFAIGGKAINSEAITKMYLYKQGTVKHIIVSDQGNGLGQIAIVILKNVKTVNIPDIKHNKILDEQRSLIEETRRIALSSDPRKLPFFSFGETTSTTVKVVKASEKTVEDSIILEDKKPDVRTMLKNFFSF